MSYAVNQLHSAFLLAFRLLLLLLSPLIVAKVNVLSKHLMHMTNHLFFIHLQITNHVTPHTGTS